MSLSSPCSLCFFATGLHAFVCLRLVGLTPVRTYFFAKNNKALRQQSDSGGGMPHATSCSHTHQDMQSCPDTSVINHHLKQQPQQGHSNSMRRIRSRYNGTAASSATSACATGNGAARPAAAAGKTGATIPMVASLHDEYACLISIVV